jgi:hypothetical protein
VVAWTVTIGICVVLGEARQNIDLITQISKWLKNAG